MVQAGPYTVSRSVSQSRRNMVGIRGGLGAVYFSPLMDNRSITTLIFSLDSAYMHPGCNHELSLLLIIRFPCMLSFHYLHCPLWSSWCPIIAKIHYLHSLFAWFWFINSSHDLIYGIVLKCLCNCMLEQQ